MAELPQTAGNASSSDVGVGDRTAPFGYEAHSPQSHQDLHSVAPPCVSEEEEGSDSSVESKTLDLHPEENILGNVCRNSEEDLLSFAEVLYKCTLCTSLPSILTSKETFIAHVTQEHLTTETRFNCGQCDLKLSTEEDLRAHVACAHSDKEPEVGDRLERCQRDMYPGSPLEERPPLPMTPAYQSNPTTPVRTESPTPRKKDFPCNKYQVVKPSAPVVKVNDVPKNENISKIQKLTEEIVQSQTPGTQANLMQAWSNMSSFTPEFGRYTKLIREGGNIVYFCQVCNWKCQVKAAFQAHCNGPHHHNKVRIGDQNNPHRKRGGSSGPPAAVSPSHSGGSPAHSMSPGLLSIVPKSESDNNRTDTPVTPCRVDGQFKLETGGQLNGSSPDPRMSAQMIGHNVNPCTDRKQNISEMPFLQGLLSSQKADAEFHGSFVFQKRSEKSDTDNVNPGLSAEAYFDKSSRNPSPSKFMEQGSSSQDNSIPRNKRKRPVPVSLRNQIESRTSWSDSDSEETAARAKISDCSSNDGDRSADKRFKQEELSPVQKDDFHSRLMRKNIAAVSTHGDRSSTSSPAGSGMPAGDVSPYAQNSFRNRLFASAFGASWGPMYGWFGQTNPPFQPAVYSSDTNGINKDKMVSESPFENSIHYGSKLFPNAFTGFDYSGKHREASEVLTSRHDNQNSDNSSDKDDNSRHSDTASENVLKTAIKHESEEAVFRCSMCEYSCQDVHSYRHHFMVDHGVEDTDGYLGDGQFSSMNEGWKMSKIRDCLSGELTVRIPGRAYPYRTYQCF